ncbi:hypothetical protein SDC9_46361 [bioreactor metagenome]|uniref:Uncharacterized protein n=1 Tax=bioreactor metagenome TaxID=1076179 RepID=A0A644W9E7_9ZZZZ
MMTDSLDSGHNGQKSAHTLFEYTKCEQIIETL